jgi:hypothetical protein
VDSEREGRRLERRHPDLPLRQHSDERRRERAVLRHDRVLGLHPVGQIAGVMVEDHRLDVRVARHRLEIAEARRRRGFDDDQPPDRLLPRPRTRQPSSSEWQNSRRVFSVPRI